MTARHARPSLAARLSEARKRAWSTLITRLSGVRR
jgi:hypothetical protein